MPSSSAGLLNSVLYWFLQLTHCSCSQTYFYHAVLRGVLFSIIQLNQHSNKHWTKAVSTALIQDGSGMLVQREAAWQPVRGLDP